MDTSSNPSAPPLNALPSAPPTYDEAVGNATSESRDQNNLNPAQMNEEELKKKEDQKKQATPLNAAPPLVTTQPLPQPEATYNFNQPSFQRTTPVHNDCLCCIYLDGDCCTDVCYACFCCSRHAAGHDAGCCDCGDTCCSCQDGCCDCGDTCCDCGDCDCGDCDCGNCDCGDCNCDCGDCVIL